MEICEKSSMSLWIFCVGVLRSVRHLVVKMRMAPHMLVVVMMEGGFANLVDVCVFGKFGCNMICSGALNALKPTMFSFSWAFGGTIEPSV